MFLGLAFTWLSTTAVQTAQAQDASETPQAQAPADPNAYCGSAAYLAALKVRPKKNPNSHRQVQMINCSDQILLGAANAPRAAGAPPFPAFPQEGTWVMQPYDPNNNDEYPPNVLTIDVPTEWEGQHEGGNTPNFWVRTGCRYDPVSNRAQCETGGCGGQYDCSSANLGTTSGATLVEWTFYQPFMDNMGNTFYFDSPDISAVNGANLTVDVSPLGGHDLDPINPKDWHWLNWNYPLTVHGKDLREPTQCIPSNGSGYKLTRTAIDNTPSGGLPGYGILGFVIVDGMGNPTMPAGNRNIACLSNCGKFKFPLELGEDDCDTNNDANCYYWTTFCAGNTSIKYGKACNTGVGDGTQCNKDSDCLSCNPGDPNLYIACFKNSGPTKLGECQLRGFFKSTVAQCNGPAGLKCGGPPGSQCAAPTSEIACPNTYGSINKLDPDGPTKFDYNDQPPVLPCNMVKFKGTTAPCIGEDTLHAVLHGAYTWPNDPQVYQSDAPTYRMVFSPEGRGQALITAAQPLPACDSLPANYKPSQNRTSCGGSINGQNAEQAIAIVRNQSPNQWQSTGSDWPCTVGSQRASADNGIVCAWNPLPQGANCQAPKTDTTYVLNSACGRIDSGTSLVSGAITPNSSGDALVLEVSIPSVLNPVSVPTSANISGCVSGAWSMIASQTLNGNQGVIAFYKGTSNTGSTCQVTVTLASANPAELKLYDVPKFNGTLDRMSTASGVCNLCTMNPYGVSAGTTTTTANDLQFGALLQVNQTTAPITYWQNWLSNANPVPPDNFTCLNQNLGCPADDGTDYLPGHGTYSSNSEVGHNPVAAGTQLFYRNAGLVTGQSSFTWVGLAIYVGLR